MSLYIILFNIILIIRQINNVLFFTFGYMRSIKYIYLSIALLLVSFTLKAQLQTYWSPVHLLVQSEFLGANYSVSNVQFTGNYNAIGSFEASMTNLGITTGVIMTTGNIYYNTSGPIGPNNSSTAGIDNSYGGSTLLSSIAGGYNTYNSAILEFDFVPSIDSLDLKFIFGSEEYPEYAPPNNSNFNDVFGIFIEGPGITGLQNIAKLPNGTFVSINNVNSITNSFYYVNNGDGNSYPYNQSPEYIQYDGFTKVLSAKADLHIGQTYHLQIAIADVGDGIYDSGIFIGSCETCDFYAGSNENTTKTTKLYPNPVSDILSFNTVETIDFVEIMDITGKLVGRFNNVNSVDVAILKNGTYFLQMNIGDKMQIEKFTVFH